MGYIESELASLRKQLADHRFNLRVWQEQKAKLGLHCPPHVLQGIEDEARAIRRIESEIRELEEQSAFPTTPSSVVHTLLRGQDVVNVQRAIGDKYEILEKIGTGTRMRTVYKARHVLLDKVVAIKLLVRCTDDEDTIELFLREARIAACLNHPHIVKVNDFGIVEGGYYYEMEFVDGKSLANIIREEGPLPVERILRIALQMCNALYYAHSKGIIHRAVIPRSILVTKDEQAKLMDFVVALVREEERTVFGESVISGHPTYMSPEQIRGEEVDGRTDIYSLGIVMYEALTGRPPFVGANTYSILYKHLNYNAPETNLCVPASVKRILQKSLEKDPLRRYADCQAMADEIERAIGESDRQNRR